MIERVGNVILVGRGDISEYALQTIVALRSVGEELVVLKGRGDNISKAIDVYNEVKKRIGDVIEVAGINIGSERAGSRKVSYIEIKLKMRF
jgi:DNA-binding protein